MEEKMENIKVWREIYEIADKFRVNAINVENHKL